ncbi:MAG TPA: hypothetical protein PLE45_07635 [Spirochaetota bacterium]|nr:hypothetical protein [Spirochaetota bacterium]HOL57528.1 hypothetical protein [Spirochaetota bacterium]HPP05251.1 hypothetical protein [Spirochaetota bacterium]
MKERYIFIILFIFLSLACFKKERITNDSNNQENVIEENNKFKEIDVVKMRELIDKSEEMNVEVFFAISILYKNFISPFIDTMKDKPEDDQKIFFEEKTKEFFNSIKYTEEEYLEFQRKNEKALIEYLNHHPELIDYLVTIN